MWMSNRPVLVDLAKYHELIEGLELEDRKRNEYLIARWLKYVEWWDVQAGRAKWKYHALRGAVVVGGALIPALVALRDSKLPAGADSAVAIGAIVVSLVIAICAGLESLYGFGEVWREKRSAAEVLADTRA